MKIFLKKAVSGSMTIEASFIVPLILFAMASLMVIGLQIAGNLASDARQAGTEWTQIESTAEKLPFVVRAGEEASEIIDFISDSGN